MTARPMRTWLRSNWRKLLALMFVMALLQLAPVAYANGNGPGISGQPPPTGAVATASPAIGAATPSVNDLVTRQYESISQNAIEKAWNNLNTQYGGYISTSGSGQIVPMFFPGNQGLNLGGLLRGLLAYLLNVFWQDGRLLGTLIILTVLAAVLETLQSAFESQLVSSVAFLVVNMVLLVLAVSSFHDATTFANGAIDTMTGVMYGSLPIVLALITASGGLTSAAVFHPMIVFVVNAVGTIVHTLVFPMIFFAAVLTIASTISGRFKLTALAGFIRTVTMAVLGLGLTAFLGILSVQGSLASISDGVTLRSVKFVASNLVPVVGKALSDASESIAGASLIVKNATGMASAVLLLLIAAFPALKILALSLVYNVSAAILQPLGDSPIITSLSTIGKSLTLVFAALAAVGLMFFFSIVITVAATNLTAFVR